ncbi:glycosyltransferase family 4 protein [Candidatus Sumerlaeota bacterium]|nr:glycosyltransferase family 4 protein [Candidatus Sumerlaeota bacterium]
MKVKQLHIMTARYVRGDAIGHYMDVQRRAFEPQMPVTLYADGTDAGNFALDSSRYVPLAGDLLWLHFSIDAPHLQALQRGPDLKVLDYHGLCPPELFLPYQPAHAKLMRRGQRRLREMRSIFDWAVAHSDYTRRELQDAGYKRVARIPLAVPEGLLNGAGDPALERDLARLEYVLFTGRIVPQKNILGALDFFEQLEARRPGLKFLLAGSGGNTPGYFKEVLRRIDERGMSGKVCLLGPVKRPEMLRSLYAHARLLIMLSRWETFCAPLAEAMAHGVPPVAANNTAIPETLNGAGILVEDNAASLEQALDRADALLADPDAYAAEAEKCRRAAERYAEPRVARALNQFLNDCATKHKVRIIE